MSYYKFKKWKYLVGYSPMPNIVFDLGLSTQEIAILGFLISIEDKKTYQCHPSYARIGRACSISVNTVRKYVQSLESKGFISTKPTKVTTRDGKTRNGNLLYTILPIQPIVEDYYQEKMRKAKNHALLQKAIKKYGRINFEKVNL